MLERLRKVAGRARSLLREDRRRPVPRVEDTEAHIRLGAGYAKPHRLLEGRQVLITGAGRNIGRYAAQEMAAHGARVYLVDVDADACRRVEAEIPDGAGHGFVCDTSKTDDIDALWRSLEGAGARIDVLVNSASHQPGYHGLMDSDPGLWERTFATNIHGPVHLTRLVARRLAERKQPGSIVFISSVHQWITGGWPAYSASKSALAMLVKELALELAPLAIRVNAIAPGWVAEASDHDSLAFDHAPLGGRAIPPRYIGRTATLLAADHYSAFTTGSVVQVDAGLSLRSYRTPARGSAADPHIRK